MTDALLLLDEAFDITDGTTANAVNFNYPEVADKVNKGATPRRAEIQFVVSAIGGTGAVELFYEDSPGGTTYTKRASFYIDSVSNVSVGDTFKIQLEDFAGGRYIRGGALTVGGTGTMYVDIVAG